MTENEHDVIPLDPNFRIELPNFEGPLDLLLHLIRKHELDVLDLPVAFVTDKYIEYIDLMEQMNLDVASEYLVMAATLAHIKSKTLLPRPPEDQTDEGEEELDPRAELIRRLLEYQKYKRVAEELAKRPIAGRDVFARGTEALKPADDAPLREVSVFKLLDALQGIAKRMNADLSLQVDAERITIQDRMTEVIDQLKSFRQCRFEDLFGNVATTYDLVVTFLALLEMAKMRILRVYQSDTSDAIHLQYTLLDDAGTPMSPDSIDAEVKTIRDETRRQSVIVPAGTSTYTDEVPS
ncbi:MAG: segregation/condensation protein A [Polyangiales bacterium]